MSEMREFPVKRYEMHFGYGDGDIIEAKDGSWVTYDDYKASEDALRAENERLKQEIADALDVQYGNGPTALEMLFDDRNALRKRVGELEQQLARVEGYPGNAADMLRLQKSVDDAYGVVFNSPELNMSNYDHDQVAVLNTAMCEVCNILGDVVTDPHPSSHGKGR